MRMIGSIGPGVNRRGPARWAVPVGAGIASAAVATAVALLVRAGATSAVSIYILGVAAAVALGGWVGGFVAAIAGFVGLNYFFTPPTHTLKVASVADAIALVVF